MKKVPSGSAAISVITRLEGYPHLVRQNKAHEGLHTMRSMTHLGLATSGRMETQLSRATPKLDPPQDMI